MWELDCKESWALNLDCSPPGSSVHGILQARILKWVAISFSRGSSQNRTWISCMAGRFFTNWATREAAGLYSPCFTQNRNSQCGLWNPWSLWDPVMGQNYFQNITQNLFTFFSVYLFLFFILAVPGPHWGIGAFSSCRALSLEYMGSVVALWHVGS